MVKKEVSSLCEKEKQQQEEEEFVGMEYERVRARRIKENMEKLRELGIKVRSPMAARISTKNINKKKKEKQPKGKINTSQVHPSMPRRTSSRLIKKTNLLVMMNEEEVPIDDETCRKRLGKGKVKADDENHGEIYTSEHENLLGDCKTPWDDGINSKRSYDSVNGITCHQCRQKTLGLRTGCNQCHLPHGRLCGNCLYTRYGENLLEAKENENWTCLVCRGICNCSRCRQQKGWLPTGPVHHEASELGFKSVAHYLIHTRRAK